MRTTAHRFLLAVVALLVVAAPAGAAEVARIEGASLDAQDRRGDLCLEVTEERGEFESGGFSTCERAPWRPRRSSLVTSVDDDRLLAAGAVPAAIARAEAELADGRRVGFDTVAGPGYRGRYAGRLRFFLASLPLTGPSDDAGGLVAVRLFGADGSLQGIAAGGYLGVGVGPRRVLLRERAGRRSTTVIAETRRRIASTPLQLDRVEDQVCLSVRSRTRFGESGSSTSCHDPGPGRPELLVLPEPGCDGLRTVVSGIVGDAVTAVRLRLGSGRVRVVRTRTFRDAQGGEHRYLATAVPRGEAVRSVSAVGVDASYDLGEPSSGLPCTGGGGIAVYGFLFGAEPGEARPPAGDEQVAAEAGGHRLLVRDGQADRLCAGIDRLRADQGDCLLPAANGEDAFGLAASGMVAAVLPAEVARVRLPDGREVPTVEGGYGGRYAGAVRFLLAEARMRRVEDRFRLLDSAGAVIGSLPVYDPDLFSDEPAITGGTRLAGGRGWRLAASRHRFGSCLTLTLRGEDAVCATGLRPAEDSAFAAVGCSPRVAVLTGTLGRGTRTVSAVLRGGRTLRARTVRVPRRFGGGRAWVLALPRTARVRALRFDGRRATYPLLPAADQCGYRVHAPGIAESELALRPR